MSARGLVKTGKSRSEQMFSGLPPKADSDLRLTSIPLAAFSMSAGSQDRYHPSSESGSNSLPNERDE